MAGSLNKLTAKEATAITAPGRHADGGNLFLRVRPSGSKAWTFLYERTVLDPATGAVKRKQTGIVLGPYGSEKGGLTLAEAGHDRGCEGWSNGPRSTVLTEAQEAMVVAFRRYTLLPLVDCLYALKPSIPYLTRSALHRCLAASRHLASSR